MPLNRVRGMLKATILWDLTPLWATGISPRCMASPLLLWGSVASTSAEQRAILNSIEAHRTEIFAS